MKDLIAIYKEHALTSNEAEVIAFDNILIKLADCTADEKTLAVKLFESLGYNEAEIEDLINNV